MTDVYLSPEQEILRREIIERILRAKLDFAGHESIPGVLDFTTAHVKKGVAERLDAAISEALEFQRRDR